MAKRRLHRRYGRMGAGSVVEGLGSVYARLKAAGAKMDHHESDLYVKATPATIAMTAGYPSRSFFTDSIDKERWIELPFAYTPFWEKKR
jgi:hypothetical protein